jgi:hypothetical protein
MRRRALGCLAGIVGVLASCDPAGRERVPLPLASQDDPLVWARPEQRLAPTTLQAGDRFGSAVSLSGTSLLIGADGNGSPEQPGAAQVWVHGATGWTLQGALAIAGANPTSFGGAVAIDHDTAIVGAGDQGTHGAAYVFVRSGTTWTQQAELVTTSEPSGTARFGQGVAVSGDTAVVGSNRGSFVFVRSGATWTQQANLTGGWAPAIDGDTIATGELGAGSGSPPPVRVFVRSGTTWAQQATLLPSDVVDFDYYGWSVAVRGDTLVAGAPDQASDEGAAYVFVRSGATWSQQAKLMAVAGLAYDQFGWSVALDADALVVGAPGQRKSSGAAYFFTRKGTSWTQEAHVAPKSLSTDDRFGASVALAGALAAVGAPTTLDAGATWTFATAGALGDACASDAACVSGHCVDGVCCDTAACSTCATCAATGSVPAGSCHAKPRGAAPTSSCGTYACDGASVACPTKCASSLDCAAGYACDSAACTKLPLAGACRANEECLSGFCTDGVCCGTATCADGQSCGVAGHAGSCATAPGAGCKADGDCGSGHCVDGVCCDTACAGQCEACDVPGSLGTCTPVAGAPHGKRAACDAGGGKACAARACDGAKDRTTCAGFVDAAAVPCGGATCAGAKFTAAPACDGAGTCVSPSTVSCAPYACGAKGCLTTCADDMQCASGFYCASGACIQGPRCNDDATSSIAPDGKETACAPYLCGSAGACNETCATSRDCAAGAACDGLHCVATDSLTSGDGGGCQSAGGAAGSIGAGAFAIAFAGALGARRRRRRDERRATRGPEVSR